MTTIRPDTAPDYESVTARHRTTWAAGDFARLGSLAVLHGELLCEAVGLRPGERVLDVATGNGAAAVAAARRWADVTASDFVDHLLESTSAVAAAYGLELATQVGDAQNLPFEDHAFDVVLSTFGAMFAPDQQRAADELVRVCRPGGRIGMANWTPGSLIGDVFRTTAAHVPPPRGVRPAIEWGTEQRLKELFGDRIRSLRIQTRQYIFRYKSPNHMLEYTRTWYGPTRMAFGSLDEDGQNRLAADLLAVYHAHNRADDGTLVAPSDYAEVVAVVS
jgi:ubiquinone/menaquinone biosynthesis C-methylase UbiE